MKRTIIGMFGIVIFFGLLNASSLLQESKVLLSVKTSEQDSSVLLFRVDNRTNKKIETGEFCNSKKNWLVVKNPQGLEVTFRIDLAGESIKIPANTFFEWEFSLTDFFYPKVPWRWADNKGEYQIYWEFNGLISDTFVYQYK